MEKKSYHYKFNLPLIGILLFAICIASSFFLLRGYITGEHNVDPDPRMSYEVANKFLSERFPIGYVLLALAMFVISVWSSILAWRSTLSLLGKDHLPLVFTEQALVSKTIYGRSISIAWDNMSAIKLDDKNARFYSRDGSKRFSIAFVQIEGLDRSQIKKDILRFNSDAEFSEKYT